MHENSSHYPNKDCVPMLKPSRKDAQFCRGSRSQRAADCFACLNGSLFKRARPRKLVNWRQRSAHDAAPPYHRFADFARRPLVWRGGAAAPPNCAPDALLGSKNTDPNDGNWRQYHPLHQDRKRNTPRLLHTLRTQLDMFEKLVPALSRSFTVYALDYPDMVFRTFPRPPMTLTCSSGRSKDFLDK